MAVRHWSKLDARTSELIVAAFANPLAVSVSADEMVLRWLRNPGEHGGMLASFMMRWHYATRANWCWARFDMAFLSPFLIAFGPYGKRTATSASWRGSS